MPTPLVTAVRNVASRLPGSEMPKRPSSLGCVPSGPGSSSPSEPSRGGITAASFAPLSVTVTSFVTVADAVRDRDPVGLGHRLSRRWPA